MDHTLSSELLHHPPGGELVVLRAAQQPGNHLERLKKFRKILEVIKSLGLLQAERPGVVTQAELDEGGGRDGALEVKMKLGLGQAADEPLDFGHDSSLVGTTKRQPATAPRNLAPESFP